MPAILRERHPAHRERSMEPFSEAHGHRQWLLDEKWEKRWIHALAGVG